MSSQIKTITTDNQNKICLLFSTQNFFDSIDKIKKIKPNVVWLNNISLKYSEKLIHSTQPFTQLIVGKIDIIELPNKISYIDKFDIIFCSSRKIVDQLRNAGMTAYYQPNYIEMSLLLSMRQQYETKKYPVTFIGRLNNLTDKYSFFFEKISVNTPIEFWGTSVLSFPLISTIQKKYHGETTKNRQISILKQSKITINPYIDDYYYQRLFYATACGALLIAEYNEDLCQLFEIGTEIVVYRTPEECIDLIKYYLNHPDEAQIIAKAGQKRTLKDHTFETRIKKTAEILERHLRYQKEKNRTSLPQNISTSFKLIHKTQVEERLTKSWQNESIPLKQRGLTQKELRQMYQGKAPIVFQVLAAAMSPIIKPDSSVLEIGCSTGYYYEILEYLLNMDINYTGGDYSFPMIQMAKDYYPYVPFHVFDGAFLPYADQSFTIVISSCVLLHTPNYQEQILETARIAKDYIVAHRTPICRKKATSYFTKYAYDVETVELIFNENEFVSEFQKNSFELKNYYVVSENKKADIYNITYVFKRKQNILPTSTNERSMLQDSIYKEMTEKPEQIWNKINDVVRYYNKTSFKC